MTSEVNVLKHFEKAQGGILGPSVYDVDDWEAQGIIMPFYVMNVIEGESLIQFIQNRGKEWIPVFMIQLLGFLQELHQQGWVFGDLKPDNLQISGHPPKIAWFDAGGITKLGRSIKEYTELYDRGYWHMGDRKAEPSYDLFSVAMIFLNMYYGKLQEPSGEGRPTQLHRLVHHDRSLGPYQKILWKAIEGKYASAQEMKRELMQVWHLQKREQTNESGTYSRRQTTPVKKSSFLKKTISFLFVSSFLIFLFTLYLFSQTL